MMVGGIVGILFVTLLRRVMVEDPELKFPESVAASEIHKAGRGGATGAKYLFYAMGIGGFIELLKGFNLLAAKWEKFSAFASKIIPRTGIGENFKGVATGGGFLYKTPVAEPRLPGRGLHHRPAPGGAELRRRRPLLGPVRAAADPAAGAAVRARGQRRAAELGRRLHRRFPEHRQDRGHRRHADERGLHAVQDAQEPDRRHRPLGQRRQEGGHQQAGHPAHRQGHQHQDRLLRPAGHGRGHLRRLLVVHGLQPGATWCRPWSRRWSCSWPASSSPPSRATWSA